MFMIANVIAIMLWTKFIETPTDPWALTLTMTWQRVVPFLLVSFALAPVFIWDAMKLSNRFVGPIVRVRKALSEISAGNAPRAIVFRRGDFWKSLAVDFNRALASSVASKELTNDTK